MRNALARRHTLLGLFAVSMLAVACSSASSAGGGPGGDLIGPTNPELVGPEMNAGTGGMGATPGGSQDIGYARRVIENGQVPPPESMTVEGLLSEHDLPIDGPSCDSLLCARPSTAWAPSFETGKSERWIKIGMASGIQSFTRPPLDAVVLIDRSGSMSSDIAQTTEAVARMIDKLRDDDRLAVLTFADGVETLQPFGPVTDRVGLKAKVKAIAASGSPNMLPGLQQAFDVARAAGADPSRLRRVMTLTCGYPDSTSRGAGTFFDTVSAGANDKIGFSIYGVLLGFDFRMADTLSHARGGSYSYLESLEKIERVFDTDFDTMVTPIAYDLHFSLALPAELEVSKLYGIPGDPNGAPKTSFDVATAFISKRKGAIVARVHDKPGAQPSLSTGAVRLAYEPETAVKNEAPSDVTTPCGDVAETAEPSYGGQGVHKAVFLVNQLEGMKKACGEYLKGDKSTAQATVASLVAYMKADAAKIADPALDPEIALVEKLAQNMTK